jgi:hypothetical protein
MSVQRDGGCACGAVRYRLASEPMFIHCCDCLNCHFVRGGTLDDPADIRPDVHIFTRSKVRWVTLPEGTPRFDVYYDSEKLWPAASLRRLKSALGRGSR